MDGEVARPLPPGAETSSSRTITPIPKSSHAWGAWGPHPEAPLSHPWAPQAHRGPLLPIHKEPSTHGNASQGCILCIVLSKVGGGEDAGAKPCHTDLCSGPENGSKLQNSRKRKKKINHHVSSSIRSWEQTDSCRINMSQPGKRRGNIFISSIR